MLAETARKRWDIMAESERKEFARSLVRKSEKTGKYADIFITKDEWAKLEEMRMKGLMEGKRANNKYPGESASLEDKTVWLVRYIKINAVLDSDDESHSEKGQERSDREAYGSGSGSDKAGERGDSLYE